MQRGSVMVHNDYFVSQMSEVKLGKLKQNEIKSGLKLIWLNIHTAYEGHRHPGRADHPMLI